MVLYLKTTTDEYELPEAVADSYKELAEMTGKTPGSVASYASRDQCGFHRIVIPDEEVLC